MAIREKFEYIIDLTADKARASFQSFRSEVSAAEGPMGKFKAAGSQAMLGVQQYAAQLAVAGGAALVTFGVKAVTAFQEGALEAGKFAQATGLSNEAASRWIEIAGDIGIESSNLESAFGRFNKELGESPDKIAAFGVEVVKTNDGLVDTNATLANAIGRLGEIKDPTERAAVAQQLFGRSWQNMAELVGMSADDLKESLAGVSDAQVFDDEEVAKARELRAAWDDLSDRLTAFTLTVGGELVPVLVDVAEGVAVITDGVGKFTGAIDGAYEKLGPFGEGLRKAFEYSIPVYGQFKMLSDGVDHFSTDVAGRAVGSFSAITEAAEDAAAATSLNVGAYEDAARAAAAYSDADIAARDGAREALNQWNEAAHAAYEADQQRIADAIAARQTEIAAWQSWRDSINASTDSAEASLSAFVESSETSFEEWKTNLAESIIAQAEWKTNLAAIGAETSAEFAAALGEMGLAGAGLVQEMRDDSGKLDEAFGLWQESANQAGRDLVGEIDSIKADAGSSAHGVGQAISDGMASGIDSAAANVGNRAAAAARNALAAARNAMKIESPSRVMADQVGAPMAQGIAMGIDNEADAIKRAVGNALDIGQVGLPAGSGSPSSSQSTTTSLPVGVGAAAGSVTINLNALAITGEVERSLQKWLEGYFGGQR